MTLNFTGPYQIRVFYDVSPSAYAELRHVVRFNVDLSDVPVPGTEFGDIDCLRRVGTPVPLQTVVDSFVVVLADISSLADCAISHAELWKYAAGTEQATYVSTYSIGVAGTVESPGVVSWQTIWSFRSLEGGIMKIYVMEGTSTSRDRKTYTDLSDEEKDFADWFVEATGTFALAKDTSYPHAFLRMSPSENEAVFRKRFRA